jgi:cell wall-associated NlpC family hydrolase
MLSYSATTAAYGVPAKTGRVARYQDAAQDAATGEWGEPAATDVTPDKESKEALAASTGSDEPAQDEWSDPAPVDPASSPPAADPTTGAWIDPATVKEVEPAPVDAAPVALVPPNTLGSGGGEPWGEPIATAYITNTGGDGAPCLAAPQWGTETLAVFDEGVPVEVRAETMGEWQPVNCAGAGGYVQTAQIAWEPLQPADPVAAPEANDDGGRRDRKAGDGGGASGGNDIVDFALRYEGRPYVYAGEGPRAFDCSGFTMFVIQKTLGIDITHDMAVQYEMGSQVRRNELEPGDLVFFKNTFRRGLSHTGIYIGGGQFIHAENESTGVRISELDSDYYSSRWYGATRFS